MIRRPPRSTPCPSTTLFRSRPRRCHLTRPLKDEYSRGPLSLRESCREHDAPTCPRGSPMPYATILTEDRDRVRTIDRTSTRLNSSHANISYAVFCLKHKRAP